MARERRPAAILLDMGLPLLDGAAVADRIRDMYEDPVPLIVVTAGGRAEDVSRIRPMAQITKPFNVADLVAAVTLAVTPPPSASDSATALPAEG